MELNRIRNRIILHHSATPKDTPPEAIRAGHAKRFKGGFGYHHYFYWKDGVLTHYLGRPEIMEGAHCKGMNANTIGACIAGNFDHDTLSEKDFDFITEKMAEVCYRNKIDPELIDPHNKYRPTACPGKYLINNLQRIRDEAAAKQPLKEH